MEGSDVIFSVAGEKFHAHKLVLTARSPVFRSEFFDGSEGDIQEIIITDVEPKDFKVRTLFILSFLLVPWRNNLSCWSSSVILGHVTAITNFLGS